MVCLRVFSNCHKSQKNFFNVYIGKTSGTSVCIRTVQTCVVHSAIVLAKKKKKVSIKGLISRHINWAIGNKWAIKWAIKLDNISQYSFNCPLQITPLPYGAL